MKINGKVFAATLAALGMGSSAFAAGVNPPWVTAPFQTLFISGSSAAVPILEAAANDVCTGKAWDEFRDVADVAHQTMHDFTASDQNYTAYYCTWNGANSSVSTTDAALGGKNVLVEKRSAGGSVYGVNAVAQATSMANMALTAGNCADVGPDATNPNAEDYACTGTSATQVADAGISDVEPSLLQINANFPTGTSFSPMTPGQLSVLTASFPFAQGFGIIVSQDVYNAGTTNLSKAQITALLSGSYLDWSEINPTLSGAPKVCFRVPGSGTRASAQAFFLDIGCKPSGAQSLVGGAILGSGAGNVRTCANTNTLAIGILGLADGPNGGDTYKFVSIDGIAPTPANVATAKYQDYVESAMTRRNTTVAGVAPLAGDQLGVYNVLLKELSSYQVISTLATVTGNSNLNNALFALDPTTLSGIAPTVSGSSYSYNSTYPISWATKNNNTCQQPSLQYP